MEFALAPELKLSCKLYHKTTWFETMMSIQKFLPANCCKLYHKTTWFETLILALYLNN